MNHLQRSIRDFLKKEFERRKTNNSAYSLRAFASYLNVSPATLVQFINGKRAASEKFIKKIISSFSYDDFDPTLKKLVDDLKSNSLYAFEEVDSAALRIISDWRCAAIISLSRTEDFQSDPSWIASRLGLAKEEAQEIIDYLKKVNFFIPSEDGSLIPSQKKFQTPDNTPDEVMLAIHKQSLDLAYDCMSKLNLAEYAFSGITVGIDSQDIDKANEMIFEFRRNFYKTFSFKDKKNEVYRLNLQFFPLTKKT